MWLELHQSLVTHRKTLRLQSLLGLRAPQAIGHLCLLWLWALDSAPDGDLRGVSERELAQVAQFNPRRAEDFVAALVAAGFLDRTADNSLVLHDWDDYAGRLRELREKNRERKRRYRERLKSGAGAEAEPGRDAPVTALPDTTGHDMTPPDPTGPDMTRQTDFPLSSSDLRARKELSDAELLRRCLQKARDEGRDLLDGSREYRRLRDEREARAHAGA